MKRRERFAPTAAIACAVLMALAAPAAAADDPAAQSPFGGQPVPRLTEPSRDLPRPPGAAISAAEAIDAASSNATIREERSATPGAQAVALIRGARWQVEYRAGDDLIAYAIVDGDGHVDEAWRDFQVSTPLARGYQGFDRPEGQRSVRVDCALSALRRAVFRPTATPSPGPPGPVRDPRPRGLAVLLQPRRDHRFGRAHLSRSRLSAAARIDRGLSPTPRGWGADSVRFGSLARFRRVRSAGRTCRTQHRRLARDRHRRRWRDWRRSHRRRTGALRGSVLARPRSAR